MQNENSLTSGGPFNFPEHKFSFEHVQKHSFEKLNWIILITARLYYNTLFHTITKKRKVISNLLEIPINMPSNFILI